MQTLDLLQMNQAENQLMGMIGLTAILDNEEWILTPEEEAERIQHAATKAKEKRASELSLKGFSKPNIISQLSQQIEWLSDEEKRDVLRQANSSKLYIRWEKDQRAKEKAKNEQLAIELKNTWTANRIYKLMVSTANSEFSKKLIFDSNTKLLIS